MAIKIPLRLPAASGSGVSSAALGRGTVRLLAAIPRHQSFTSDVDPGDQRSRVVGYLSFPVEPSFDVVRDDILASCDQHRTAAAIQTQEQCQ